MKTSSLLFLGFLALHGCNTVEDPFLDGMTSAAGTAQTGNRELPVHLARASLTGLGEAPLSVRQTMSNGGARQDIVYANRTAVPGDNRLTLVAASAAKRDGQRGPSRNEIAKALQTDFPGIRMGIDPVIRRNSYGPYGTATGKLGNDGGCVYAWQALDKNAAVDLAEPITIRLRYCRPDIGPEILADLLGGLTLGGGAGAQVGPVLGSLHQTTSTYAYSAPETDKAPPRATAFISRIEPARDQTAPAEVSAEETPPSTAAAIPMPE
ncbi:hypothetical protein FVA81_12175 [Rhizobium sp. WL3]|uniref:cellulose biosynthesis protein BcsN n=1 Tax=Rhizobium sp. WL3 TaxID=2603277 RepID=UPI0011C20CE6|nr:cellulose biosynthesis protein BcsN [Rhizobium sp. WL3]QEE45318.1 hypothetical protein FVA81_12175 [Rhizobium sp. WL3]